MGCTAAMLWGLIRRGKSLECDLEKNLSLSHAPPLCFLFLAIMVSASFFHLAFHYAILVRKPANHGQKLLKCKSKYTS